MSKLKAHFHALLMIVQIFHNVHSANILFYHHLSSYSHRVSTYPLADALAKLGHQVTYISPFHPRGPYINPNITEIVPKKSSATMEAFLANDFDINFRIHRQLSSNVFAYFPTAIVVCEELLGSEELRDFLEKTTTLDLMIMDNCMSECGMAIAYKYKAKHITFNTVTFLGNEYDLYGVIPESSSIPELELFTPQPPMKFLERVKNTLTSIMFRGYHYIWYVPQIDQLIRKYMGHDDMPFVDEVFRNKSLVLLGGDMVTDFSRSIPPLVVNIGGIHCKTGSNELPEKLKRFVEGKDTDGFVYISLGSLVVSSNLPDEIREAFFQTIESFPKLRFLWKWNGQHPKKIPNNLYLDEWFPQTDLLAHPKLKAFVTQSGRPSTLEAVCAAVPMIALPVMGDQDLVAVRMNEIGGNILLEIGSISKEQLRSAIETAAYDKRMKNRMLELKNILNDQPMPPLDRAVWWTEYVLRHKDTSHLKPAGFHQWWFERRLLDVWAFIFSIILLTCIVITAVAMIAVKLMFKLLCRRNAKVRKNEKLKKKLN